MTDVPRASYLSCRTAVDPLTRRKALPASRKPQARDVTAFLESFMFGPSYVLMFVQPLGLQGPPCWPPPTLSGLACGLLSAHGQEAGGRQAGACRALSRAAGTRVSMASPPFPCCSAQPRVCAWCYAHSPSRLGWDPHPGPCRPGLCSWGRELAPLRRSSGERCGLLQAVLAPWGGRG